jgi:large subunit ribosomal protein L30
MLRIRQVRSRIGQTKKQHEVLRTLGLRHIGHVVERPDNAAVRGAVQLVSHLVTIENERDAAAASPAADKAQTAKAGASRETDASPVKKKTKKKATKKKAAKKKSKAGKAAKKTKKKTSKKKKKKASGGES